MANDKNPSQFKTPTDIARETFKQLAIQRIAPTPEAYSKLYKEISGEPAELPSLPEQPEPSEAEKLLVSFAKNLQQGTGELSSFGHRFSRAIKGEDWDDYAKGLSQLAEKINVKPPTALSGISLVDDVLPPPTNTARNISLVDDVPAPASNASSRNVSLVDDGPSEDPKQLILKDLLFRTLSLALSSLLQNNKPLAQESDAIADAVKQAQNEAALNQISSRLKHLCFQIELSSGDTAEQQELLLRLFSLLLNNVHELLDEDNWLRGQIEVIQSLIAGPIDHRALQEATRSLKDVIYKQGVLKNRLDESKTSVKNMMATFIDRLDAMALRTDTYHHKIDDYAHQLDANSDVETTRKVIKDILSETESVQTETLRTRDLMLAAQKEVKEAETRIKELEDKLAHMSELVREDQLTGSLNRRGLEDVYEREADRADRRGTPLCIAMLDLDNFKKLNDTHGHAAGDSALIHVVRIVKQTLRSIDVIARYGGEEFLIVMPETTIDEAAQAMVRVQRELTTHFFTANDQRLFITFSAGVALRQSGEHQDLLIKRADKAMYEAKQTGKNRVVKAELPS
jgi:diguanylate cyclase